MAQKKLPSVLLRAGEDRRVRAGHPWAFSNEILMDAETKALPPGSLATLRAPGGEALGLITFNPHSLIAGRVLSSNPEATVDALFLGRRLAQATALRDRLVGVPYYRLIHAEADGLPGVIVDRFGDALVVQVNTAGMETADAGAARGARGRAFAQDDRAQERFAGARARRPEARDHGRQGRCVRHRRADRERRALRGRPVGRPEDRLVLRPARQPPLHGGARPRTRASSTSSATAAASACWPPSRAPSR